MALAPRLELRQTQTLVMTPQLRQAIQMLQMSALDLTAFLAAEIERNPLIDLAETAPMPRADAATIPESFAAPEPSVRAAVDVEIARADPAAAEVHVEAGRDNLYEAAEPASLRGAGSGGRDFADESGEDAAARLPQGVTLAQHVIGQLGLMRLVPATRAVAEALACEIDETGYLRIDPVEAALRLGASVATVEAARAAIQACEPTGVGARDLRECLALQLAERDRLDPAMAALLARLESLPRTPAPTMAALVGVSLEDLDDMLGEIRRLDPRPGLAIGGGTADPVIPDVIVRPDGAGGWAVELNPDAAPRLLIDRSYAARVPAGGCKRTKLFLAECAQNAGWLARSLDQRARTILTVAAEIVRAQTGFLERGVGALRPLTLRTVADATGVHESTVSRATANKFIATPRGLFELKFFFSTAIAASDGGEAHSAEAVRGRIRALIDAEPSGRPLSDDALVGLLRAEGVDVARRTVAKYREGMGIGSSVARRRRAAAAV